MLALIRAPGSPTPADRKGRPVLRGGGLELLSARGLGDGEDVGHFQEDGCITAGAARSEHLTDGSPVCSERGHSLLQRAHGAAPGACPRSPRRFSLRRCVAVLTVWPHALLNFLPSRV